MIIFDTDWPVAPADLSVKAILGLEPQNSFRKKEGILPITDYDLANKFRLNLDRLMDLEVPEK